MMWQEFAALTGFYPDSQLYAVIEEEYLKFDGVKQDFCKAYKENKDGLAEKIQKAADLKVVRLHKEAENKEANLKKEIADLNKKISDLEALLEAEHEWHAYEDPKNVSQAEYDNLRNSGGVRELTDDEAKDIVANEFGFDRSKIRIIRDVNLEEIDRHRCVRVIGKVDRNPLWNAWDFHYIRFDVLNFSYEMFNDELRPFNC